MVASLSGCISKGDTNIGDRKDKEAEPEPDPSDGDDDDGGKQPARPEPEPEPETTSEPAPEPETTSEPAPEPAAPAEEPEDTPSPEPERPNGGGGGPGTAEPEPDEDGAAGESAGSGGTQGPTQPRELVECVAGATPGKSPAVALTASIGSKSGLRAAAGPDGFLVAWQVKGNAKVEVAYRGFDAALEPLFDESKVPDVEGAASGAAVAFSESQQAFALAYDQQSEAQLAWVTPGSGELSAPFSSGLPTSGNRLHLAAGGGKLLVSTMNSNPGCPGTGYFQAFLVNEDTHASSQPWASVGCVDGTYGTVVDPEEGFVVTNNARTSTTYQFLSFDGVLTPGGGNGLEGFAPTPDITPAWAGRLTVAAAAPQGGVSYARFKTDGTIAGELAYIAAHGVVRSLAVGDSVGVLVEDSGSVEFFARNATNGDAVHPPAVVAAQPGLTEPVLVALDGAFIVLFLADDDDGETQVFASPVLCE